MIRVLVALAAGLFLVGALVAVALPSSRSSSRLAPTSTQPYATGCRDVFGNRGPCDPAAAYCRVDAGSAPGCDIDSQPRVEKDPVPGCPVNTALDAGADEFYAPGCEPHGLLLLVTHPAAVPPLPAPPLRRVYVAGIAWRAVTGAERWRVYVNGKLAASPGPSARSYSRRVACGVPVVFAVAAWTAAAGEGDRANLTVTTTCAP